MQICLEVEAQIKYMYIVRSVHAYFLNGKRALFLFSNSILLLLTHPLTHSLIHSAIMIHCTGRSGSPDQPVHMRTTKRDRGRFSHNRLWMFAKQWMLKRAYRIEMKWNEMHNFGPQRCGFAIMRAIFLSHWQLTNKLANTFIVIVNLQKQQQQPQQIVTKSQQSNNKCNKMCSNCVHCTDFYDDQRWTQQRPQNHHARAHARSLTRFIYRCA